MTPRLLLFRSLWTNGFSLGNALDDIDEGAFDGIEGPVPHDSGLRRDFIGRLRAAGVPFIAEIATGGDYVPRTSSAEAHHADLRDGFDGACAAGARFASVLAGCDAWPVAQAVEFLGTAIEAARACNLAVSFETHRSRPTFNPWTTGELLRQLPALRLTCDFSHWCCVCERLVLDDEPALLATIARHAHHLHARVGYAQGPQVPHPAAPEYRGALEAHERWWSTILSARIAAGCESVTMTPEFGPDGYLQAQPFTRTPVANLDEVNRWMAKRLRERFGSGSAPAVEYHRTDSSMVGASGGEVGIWKSAVREGARPATPDILSFGPGHGSTHATTNCKLQTATTGSSPTIRGPA